MPPAASSSKPARAGSSSHGGSSSSKKRREGELRANEKRVHQAISARPGQSMSSTEYSEHFVDIDDMERNDIINALSRKSLIRFEKSGGVLHFIALSRKEASVMGQLDTDEGVVFSHIRDARNDGIWTKILKNKCNMHQTVITRTLKALEGKGLIKAVKSVKNPTRKIYMLRELKPSIELSGGPWYTDHELDTAFIEQLCAALERQIREATFPQLKKHPGRKDELAILPASCVTQLPSARSLTSWLKGKGVTDVRLQVADIQSLLDILVYDGKIEKIPVYGMNGQSPASKTSRRRHESDEYDDRRARNGYESVSDESEVEVDSRRKSKSRNGILSNSDSSDDEHTRRQGRNGSSKKRQRKGHGDGSSESDASSDFHDRRKKSIKLGSDDEGSSGSDEGADEGPEGSNNYVYRALRPLMTATTGWTEVPCAHCPVMNFCQPGGPINAESCIYMRDWLIRTKKRDEKPSKAEQNGIETDGAGQNGLGHSIDADAGFDGYSGAEDAGDDFAGPQEEYEDYGGEEV